MKSFPGALAGLIVAVTFVYGQTFTKVTMGGPVTDASRSTGSNWIDYDGDGFTDLFVSNGNLNSEANLLFRNLGNGAFEAVAAGDLVADVSTSIGATWADYDGDGDPDVFVANRSGNNNALYRNEGGGTFVRITAGDISNDGGDSNISSWLDIENDGDLDLFVINFNQANFLYLNDGLGNFTKIDTGIIVTTSSFSICGAWGDYNTDGLLDLFIGNGGSQPNLLFENQGGGAFTKIQTGAIVNDVASATGCSWGDYNNDGYLDLFVANFLGANNALYRNEGPPGFTFSAVTTGDIVNDGGNSVGSAWGDVDRDGDLDLFVGNDGADNFLYLNDGSPDYGFTAVTSGDVVNDAGATFGVSMADLDGDGDLDLYAANRSNQNNFLYLNDGNANHWVGVRCVGNAPNITAIGARVRVQAMIGGVPTWQTQEITAQSGYNSQNSLDAEFGLEDATQVDSLEIRWPSGAVSVFTAIPVDRLHTVTESGVITGVSGRADMTPDRISLHGNYPNPFNPVTQIEYELVETSEIQLVIFNVLGQSIRTLASGRRNPGLHAVLWDGRNDEGRFVPSGVYLYRLQSGKNTISRKMLLVK